MMMMLMMMISYSTCPRTVTEQRQALISLLKLSGSKHVSVVIFFSDEQAKLEQRRQWLDSEVEKVLRRKEAMEALEEELKKRETIIANKEAMLTEKSELEIKKLRSSQVLTKVQ